MASTAKKQSFPNRNWREEVAEEMIRQIEEGTAPWQKPWEPGVIVHQAHNASSGMQYHGINSIWLDMQGYDDPRWMTLKQANAAGATIRQGEKSTQVEYWQWGEHKPVIDNDGVPVMGDDGKIKTEFVHLDRPRVFYANVFNAAQIEGLAPYQAPEPKFAPEAAAERLLDLGGVKIAHDISDDKKNPYYDPMRDEIHLPDRATFKDAYGYYATALHELGHASGHKSRLARDFGPFNSEVYAKEELRAEMASYMVARELGLGHNPDRHAPYVKSWLKALKNDHNLLFQAARDADRIATWVQEPDLRPRLEKEAQTKQEVKTMERDQEQSQGQEQARDKSRILALNVQESLTWFYDKGQPSQDEYTRAEYADEIRVGEYEKAVLDIRKALHTEEGQVFLADVQKNGLDPQSAFFVENLKARLEIAAQKEFGLHPAQGILQAVEKERSQGQDQTNNKDAKPKRTYLYVPFTEKDQAKAQGARWDSNIKRWYAQPGIDLEPFAQWRTKAALEKEAPALDPVKEFADELKARGIKLEGAPVMDGKWQRVALEDDAPGKESASYRGFLNGRPNGQIKNYKTDELIKWVARGESLSPDDRQKFEAEAAETREKRAAERQKTQSKAQLLAMKRFDEALTPKRWEKGQDIEPQNYPYLDRKNVGTYGILQEADGKILIPARDIDGKLWSVQAIDHDGEKRFAKGGRKAGLMHIIDPNNRIGEKPVKSQALGKGTIIIAEGYATAASIFEATKQPTVAGFDAGNLKAVAEAVRAKYPDAKIVIAADNDHKLEAKPIGNVGVQKAIEAARAVGGVVVVPDLTPEQKAKGMSDWNDLTNDIGKAAVALQMRKQIARELSQEQGKQAQAMGM